MGNLQEILVTRAGLSEDVAASLAEMAKLLEKRPEARITGFLCAAQITDTGKDGQEKEAVLITAHGDDKDVASLIKKMDYFYFEQQQRQREPDLKVFRTGALDLPPNVKDFFDRLVEAAEGSVECPCGECSEERRQQAEAQAENKTGVGTPATEPTEDMTAE